MSCWCTSLLVSLLFPICGTQQEGDDDSVCCPPLKPPHESSQKLFVLPSDHSISFCLYYSPMILCLRHFRKFITFEAFELLGHLHIQELLQSSKKNITVYPLGVRAEHTSDRCCSIQETRENTEERWECQRTAPSPAFHSGPRKFIIIHG